MVGLAGAIAAGFCFVVLISYGLWGWFYWQEGGTGSKSFWRVFGWGAVSALVAWLLTLFTYPFGMVGWGCRGRISDQGEQPVLVLIHGVYHNKMAWWLFRFWLKRAGYSEVITWSYGSWNRDFWTLSRALATDLRQIGRQAGGRQVICLGHSMGGLLVRAALAQPDNWDPEAVKLAGVVTLGTPHQGSKLASLGWGGLARSLSFRGRLIAQLEALEHQNPSRLGRAVALVSPADNMVVPSTGLLPAVGQWEVRWTRPVSHIAMLYSPSVFRQVRGVLDDLNGV